MKKSRFNEEVMVFALKQTELSMPVPEVCHKLGISDATFYTWHKKYLTLARLCEWLRDQRKALVFVLRQRVSRSSFRYISAAGDDRSLCLEYIREIMDTREHYGYRGGISCSGGKANHERIYRLRHEQGLYPNHILKRGFVSDALFNGRRLRRLTIIGLYTRECLGISVGQNLRSAEVAEIRGTIAIGRPLP